MNVPEPSGSFISFENSLNERNERQQDEVLAIWNTTEQTKKNYVRRPKKRYAKNIEDINTIV